MKKINKIVLILFTGLLARVGSNAQTPGILLGMTSTDNLNYSGTIFSCDPLNNSFNTLFIFSGTNGSGPDGSLLQTKDGLIYGMTYDGGNLPSHGTIFQYNLATGNETVMVNFFDTNGWYPQGNLIQAKDSMLYGMTMQGGANSDINYPYGFGVLFRYNPVTNAETVLINFNDSDNGAAPTGSLIQATDGKLYGLTSRGGTSDSGVLFSYDLTTRIETVLVNFTKAKGTVPHGSLVQDTNGLLYGMTFSGGTNDAGVLFSYNIGTNTYTVLRNLGGALGYYPYGSLIHDTNGVLYGMTYGGGSYSNFGVLFSYNPNTNMDTILQNFSGADTGAFPYGTPLLASNGLLYGMTYKGGIGYGELFSYNLNTKKETPLDSFYLGLWPSGDLIEVMDVFFTGKDTLKCYGDSNGWAKLTVRGAKPPIHYLWTNGSTNDSIGGLKAGSDTCTVTDATGKKFTYTFNVYQPPKLGENVSVNNTCGGNGGVAWAAANGGVHPYTYSWSNSATTDTIMNLSPATYTCIVTDSNGCTASSTAIVDTAQPLQIVSIITTPAWCNTCTNGTGKVIVTGGTPAGDSAMYFYVWNNGATTDSTGNLPAGTDTLCVTSYYGCGSICTTFNVAVGVPSINDFDNEVKIYPVPSDGNVTITLQGTGFEKLLVTDELGREVYNEKLDAAMPYYVLHPDLSKLPSGIYIVQLITEKGLVNRKLIIQR